MKKLILFITAILIGFSGVAQMGDFPVSPNYGGKQAAAFQSRVLDSTGTYENNVYPHDIDKLKSYGIVPVYAAWAAGYTAGSIMTQLPTDGSGDLTSVRAGTASRVNPDMSVEDVSANTPRVDYTNGIPYFNFENATENLITYPLSFDNASWTKSGATIDDNSGSGYSSPSTDYSTSAYKLVEDGTTGNHYIRSIGFTGSISDDNTFSIYAKAGERNWIAIKAQFVTPYGGATLTYFDLENGVVGTTGAVATADIEYISNGWYKCSVTTTRTAINATAWDIMLADADNSNSYTGTAGNGAYIFGAMFSTEDYASSFTYSGTEGSTSLRAADAITGGGSASTFSSVNESGCLVARIAAHSDDGTNRYITLSDGTFDNSVRIVLRSTSNTIRGEIRSASSTVAQMDYVTSDVADYHTLVIRWDTDDFSIWVDGTEQGTDASGSTFSTNTLTTLNFDAGDGSSPFYGKAEYVYVTEYLSDEQIQNLP